MRITFRVATSGVSGATQFPILSRPAEDYCGEDGMLNEAMARADLGNTEGVQFSDRDNRATIAFAIEFLDRIRLTYSKYAEQNRNEIEIVDIKAKGKKTACDKRLLDGRVAFVRADISIAFGTVRASLSYDNPRNIVGETENFAEIVAHTFADILIAIADDLKEQNGMKVMLVDGKNCAGMFAERREKERLRRVIAAHADCKNRCGAYCSPSCPSCELYENGKCGIERIAG